MSSVIITIIVPCFNEEENIQLFYESFNDKLNNLPYQFEILFIDDGSSDKTLLRIKKLKEIDSRIHYISFTRNFGHQAALKSGIDSCNESSCVIFMDVDLEHPIHVINEFIALWKQGYKIVQGQREDNDDLPKIKKNSSNLYYWFFNHLSDTKIPKGSADFRLIDKEVISILKKEINEYHLFYRGMFNWLGYETAYVPYKAAYRKYGKTKFHWSKMLTFGLSGITSFSIKPLRISIFFGLLLAFMSFMYAIYAIIAGFGSQLVVPGWTSLITCILFIGGTQLIVLGIIGEYIGKIFEEVKKRPNYVIKEKQ